MTESIITISLAAFLAGFVFSMPIAGPISILITTNALKGKFRYCQLVNFGASFGTFTYVFIAVYGLTKLYPLYQPAIPYLLISGSLFLLFLGYRIFRTKIDEDRLEDKSHLSETILKKQKGGFYAGSIINFCNPTLFIGWLASTFFVISFVSSLGYQTGGLDISINRSVKEISHYDGSLTEELNGLSPSLNDAIIPSEVVSPQDKSNDFPEHFHLLISALYALFISLGSITWFSVLILIISRFRKVIKIKILSVFIKSLGVVLCIFGLYFGYLGVRMLLNIQ